MSVRPVKGQILDGARIRNQYLRMIRFYSDSIALCRLENEIPQLFSCYDLHLGNIKETETSCFHGHKLSLTDDDKDHGWG